MVIFLRFPRFPQIVMIYNGMLHIKPFNQFIINEALENPLEIIQALRDTPEGRDLVAIAGGRDFESIFEHKRTGRVYSTVFGSKMYMDKGVDGNYCWQALSNGKIFAQGCFRTITECIRDYWSYVASNYLRVGGKAKQEAKEILKRDIPIGSGLNLEQIERAYRNSKGIPEIDLNEILNTPTYKILEGLFGATSSIQNRYLFITFNPYKPFIESCDVFRDKLNGYYETINIGSNTKGKNLFDDSGIRKITKLSIGDPATMQEFFKKCIEKINIDLPSYLWIDPNSECVTNSKSFFDSMIKSSGSPVVLDSYLESIKLKDVTRYSSAIYSLKSAGVFPEIIRKHEEQNRSLIGSGAILKRFRF